MNIDEMMVKKPIWIRSPKAGPEHYTGLGRSKLYELVSNGHIQSRSVKESEKARGVRLFDLRSILEYIDRCPSA